MLIPLQSLGGVYFNVLAGFIPCFVYLLTLTAAQKERPTWPTKLVKALLFVQFLCAALIVGFYNFKVIQLMQLGT